MFSICLFCSERFLSLSLILSSPLGRCLIDEEWFFFSFSSSQYIYIILHVCCVRVLSNTSLDWPFLFFIVVCDEGLVIELERIPVGPSCLCFDQSHFPCVRERKGKERRIESSFVFDCFACWTLKTNVKYSSSSFLARALALALSHASAIHILLPSCWARSFFLCFHSSFTHRHSSLSLSLFFRHHTCRFWSLAVCK